MGLMLLAPLGRKAAPHVPSPAQESHPKQLRTDALYVAPVDGATPSSGSFVCQIYWVYLEIETHPPKGFMSRFEAL